MDIYVQFDQKDLTWRFSQFNFERHTLTNNISTDNQPLYVYFTESQLASKSSGLKYGITVF